MPGFETRNRFIAATAFACLLLLAIRSSAQTIQEATPLSASDIQQKTDAIAGQIVSHSSDPAKRDVGLVIGVMYQGQPMKSTYGEVRRSKGVAPNDKTEFEIGSLTKTFTGALLAVEVERGQMKLSDSVQRYLPKEVPVPRYQLQPITLLDLATHTSGLPKNMPARGSHLSDTEMYAFLSTYKLSQAPGTQFGYSNLGIALLANVLERMTDKDWEDLLEKEITGPLNMPDTRAHLDRDQKKRMAQGYTEDGSPAPGSTRGWPVLIGSTGLCSTLDDMMKYLAFNLGLTQTDLDRVRDTLLRVRHQAATPGTGIALVWQTLSLAPGSKLVVVNKNGSTSGFYSYMGFIPQTKTGVVLMGNGPVHLNRYGMELLRYINRVETNETAPVIEDAGALEK